MYPNIPNGCKLLFFLQLVLVLQLHSNSCESLLMEIPSEKQSNVFKRFPFPNSEVSEQDDFMEKWYKSILNSKKRTKRAVVIEEEAMAEGIQENKNSAGLNVNPYSNYLTKASRGLVTTEWLRENLDFHNRMREMHGSPRLQLDYKLAEAVQKRINQVVIDHAGKDEIDFGEIVPGDNERFRKAKKENGTRNTLLHLGGDFAPSNWYDELIKYDWEKNEYDPKARHATQMIWMDTKTVGCGRGVTVNKGEGKKPFLIVMCRYEPAGNDKDPETFKRNVNLPTENAEPE